MKKLLALVAIAGLSVSIIGCGDAKKKDAPKPAPTAPAETTPDAPK